ncbi:folate-binding protein YgfZ [Mesorhizobium sp. BE184]|uniref:CAF17-like 4Fe-4S cluster assembly/insertion protein YgfZ n=1 Tax=Mesorhizobium sp. BE184 TaxID=2817714 RepID=UPI002858B29C|nr:folate-binding protein YgfZ [Mesorhizobium sp. BE184]MDR7031795.1 folate-binding protein YgfZ [Mesorhizobium sp. BE184]
MPSALLKDRALVSVSGAEAEHFLQNIVTTDLDQLGADEAKPGALLAPQGKILFDFLISRAGEDGFLLECRADIADDFMRRLMLYRLRAKVDISKQEQSLVSVEWQIDSIASDFDSGKAEPAVSDRRFADRDVVRVYGVRSDEGDSAAWHAFRIAHGVAESGVDYQLGDAFPHDVLLDQNGGVGFKKGCYVGQEVVSRMQHRGTARRRVLIVSADAPLPAAGTELTVDGRPVGALGSTSGSAGLAVARIDRVKAAVDDGKAILAGVVPVHLSIPDWARFTFPENTEEA